MQRPHPLQRRCLELTGGGKGLGVGVVRHAGGEEVAHGEEQLDEQRGRHLLVIRREPRQPRCHARHEEPHHVGSPHAQAAHVADGAQAGGTMGVAEAHRGRCEVE